MNKYGWMAGSNTGGKMLQSFLHPEDAYGEAEKASNEGYDKGQAQQEPFRQGGVDQYGRLNDATGKLLDPAALQDEWSKNYKTSDYAKQQLAGNINQGQEAASAMGLNGSSAAISNIQQGAGNIQNKDRQQYMDDLMEKYRTGIGLGKGLYDTGAQTAANMGKQSQEHGNDVAGLRYGASAAPGKLFGQFAGTAANMYAPGSGKAFTG